MFNTTNASSSIIPKLLTEQEVSKIIRKSVQWLRVARCTGKGIPYRKLGFAVRYSESDVIDWINAHSLQTSTRE